MAVGAMLIERGIVGGLVGSFFLVVMLFLWVIPSGGFGRQAEKTDPTVVRVSRTVLGVGLGLFAAVAAALILPPQLFSWVIIVTGLILIVWIGIRLFR